MGLIKLTGKIIKLGLLCYSIYQIGSCSINYLENRSKEYLMKSKVGYNIDYPDIEKKLNSNIKLNSVIKLNNNFSDDYLTNYYIKNSTKLANENISLNLESKLN